MTKKVYKQKCFCVITKNFNWEILTKNLVTFLKDGMGLRMKNFSINNVGSLKNQIFGGVHEKPIYRVNCLKRGDLDSLQI